MSGAGKSVTVCDLLSQTEGYFGYTVIIEEGLSYGIYPKPSTQRNSIESKADQAMPPNQSTEFNPTSATEPPVKPRSKATE